MWTVGVAERNLFGRGQQVEVQRRSDIDRDQTLLSFRDPRVAGSRVDASVSLAHRSDGRRGELMARVPSSPWTPAGPSRARAEAFEQLDPLYQDGERVADLPHEGRALDLEGGRARRPDRGRRAAAARRLPLSP